MIGYTMFGTNDMDKATAFYDGVFEVLGYKRTWNDEAFRVWGPEGEMGSFCITKPHDGKTATCGNGTMIALAAPSHDIVDKVCAKAMELGGQDEGAPGPRGAPEMGFYAGYFRDPDGNKLNVFHMKAPG